MKKIFIFIVCCMFLSSLNFVIAAEDEVSDEEFMTDWDGTCGDMDCDEVEIVGAGITPDSPFYFIDELFDRFGDEIGNREERVAEIKSMIEAGDYEAAHKALRKYKEYAKKLEEESDPDKREESRRSAAAIKNALDEIKDDIPEENKGDFYDDIIEKEKELLTAVDISSKIKELCVQLADLDPVQYAKNCKSGDDAPKWKKNLDEDLTNEQRNEAKKFGDIMSQCFKTSGRNCECEDISFYDFSVACSKIAPLAVECDEGSESACKSMDEIKMPELPDYLQDVLDDIEGKYGEDKYDMYMPQECVDAGVTSPKECGRIMIKENAPIECRQALLDADVQNEREGREICDKIMFELHAPKECMDKGITDPEECKDFMDEFGGPRGPEGFGPPRQDCMNIEDKMERLDCFEGAVGNMGDQYGVGEKYTGNEGDVTWQCKENRIHWPPDCEIFMREEWPQKERMREDEMNREWEQKDDWRMKERECIDKCEREQRPWDFSGGQCNCGEPGQYSSGGGNFYDESECKDGCQDECPGASGTDCVDNGMRCECFYEEREEYVEERYEESNDYIDQTEEHVVETDYDEGTSPGDESSVVVETTTSTDEGSSEPVVENVVEINSDSGITGEATNEFLDYYRR